MKKDILLLLLFSFITIFLFKSYYKHKKSSVVKVLPEIDNIIVEKSNRLMRIYKSGQLIKQYKIVLGTNPVGHKEKEGDGRTPEGNYEIIYKNSKSKYHLSLKISYPNEEDKKKASEKGVMPGDNIMIHGTGIAGCVPLIKNYFSKQDWTLGCIAVTNKEIEEIYPSVNVGTKVKILP